jgi:hypothetical protein
MQYVEIKENDVLIFPGSNGSGSVVKTQKHGYYFMPAKYGMRLKGVKSPIQKNERFVFSSYRVQKADAEGRIIKCILTRLDDGTNFAVSEYFFHRYFRKIDLSNL